MVLPLTSATASTSTTGLRQTPSGRTVVPTAVRSVAAAGSPWPAVGCGLMMSREFMTGTGPGLAYRRLVVSAQRRTDARGHIARSKRSVVPYVPTEWRLRELVRRARAASKFRWELVVRIARVHVVRVVV